MNRKTVFQISRQPWFPRFLKTQIDEFLDFMVQLPQRARLPHANHPFLPLFDEVLAHSQARTLVGFESMDGGGLAHIATEVGGPLNPKLSVQLTDEQCIPARVKQLERLAGRPVHVLASSKHQVAEQFRGRGIGVFINSFHHLGRGEDRAVLQELVDHDLDVVIGEGNNKSLRQVIGMTMIVPIMMLLATPFIRPFRPSRLLFTYLVPILPFVTVWDGVAALFRLHRPEELEAMARSLGRNDYVWKAGKRENGRGGFVIYLLGYRRQAASVPA
jgi:hypothetical protein